MKFLMIPLFGYEEEILIDVMKEIKTKTVENLFVSVVHIPDNDERAENEDMETVMPSFENKWTMMYNAIVEHLIHYPQTSALGKRCFENYSRLRG